MCEICGVYDNVPPELVEAIREVVADRSPHELGSHDVRDCDICKFGAAVTSGVLQTINMFPNRIIQLPPLSAEQILEKFYHSGGIISTTEDPLDPLICGTPGCNGDARYSPPGRGHIKGCLWVGDF